MDGPVFLDELRPLMGDRVDYRLPGARDIHGKVTYGQWVTGVECHISLQVREVRDAEGKVQVSRGAVYLLGLHPVTVDAEVRLPGGDVPVILAVQTLHDEAGPLSTVVRYQ